MVYFTIVLLLAIQTLDRSSPLIEYCQKCQIQWRRKVKIFKPTRKYAYYYVIVFTRLSNCFQTISYFRHSLSNSYLRNIVPILWFNFEIILVLAIIKWCGSRLDIVSASLCVLFLSSWRITTSFTQHSVLCIGVF